jgi:hypothetical protein
VSQQQPEPDDDSGDWNQRQDWDNDPDAGW